MKILLVSVYEGGYQPITVASAASALGAAGFSIAVLDTYVDGLNDEALTTPDLVAISLPLFDAVHPGIEVANRVRRLNPAAHITFFGQHATIHAARLAGRYGNTCITGEWEEPLALLARHLSGDTQLTLPGVVEGSMVALGQSLHPYMSRDHFRVPDRRLLPPLHKYPNLQVDRLLGAKQMLGSTEISRGCHHKCLYCSVFAAYDGKVILVPEEIVLHDVRNLMEIGMTHLTFIDADFFNAKYYGMKILRKLHEAFPTLTYDITTRVDHILENKEAIREMESLGVRIITSALEFPSRTVLEALNKEITMEETEEAIAFMQQTAIKLNPTFIMFNPWIDLEDLVLFNDFVERNSLADIIDPVQYETRLSLYKGSPLLQLPSVQALQLTEQEFHMDWQHRDPRLDEIYAQSVTPPEEGVFKRCCLKC